jgi:hypothetical protein
MNCRFKCASCLVGLVLSACSTVETPQPAQGAASAQDPTAIQINQPLHFSAPDGSDVVVGTGTYRLEQRSGSQLWLIPTGDSPRTLVGAEAMPTDLDVAAPIALAIRSEQQPDAYHLVLLLPGGTALDAIGSVSGVQSRGVRDVLKDIMVRPTVFEVPQPPGPDLWPRSIYRPCPEPGNVFFVVTNSGTETAAPSTTRVEMKYSSATVRTNALAPGQSQAHSVYDSCNAFGGGGQKTCYVSVRVDVQNEVAESNEINNSQSTVCTH